jgi:hypothetical protein
MAEQWDALFEILSGDTENSTQTAYPLPWTSATVTLRRRAPHTFELRLPRTTVPGQRAIDFRAGRQFWLKRNGVYWFAGFMNCATLSGYDRAAGAFRQIVLPGWGNAYAMLMNRAVQQNSGGLIDIAYGLSDVDSFITALLDGVDHGTGGDWFPVGGRTLYASATTAYWGRMTGRSALELLNWACDVEQVAWRTGVNSSGAFTIAVGTTVDRDLSSTIKLYDNANCQIVDLQRDGSQIATVVDVVNRRAPVDTRLEANASAGATSITVTSTAGFQVNDGVNVGVGLATFDIENVTAITSGTVLAISALGSAHTRGETVKNLATAAPFRQSTRSAAASVAQAHHIHHVALYNDQMVNVTLREEYGDAYLAAYDHPLTTATVEVVDTALISVLLDQRLEPGDRISLSSSDSELVHFYNNTAVTVQEMTLELEPGRVKQVTLTVGDPRIDDLAVLDRWLSVYQQADTTARGE